MKMTPLWPLSLEILVILSTKDWRETEDSSAQISSKNCLIWVELECSLALTYRSSSFHTSSMKFKSTDFAGQDISGKTPSPSLFSVYIRQNLLVRFGSLSCMSTNSWATSRIPDGIAWRCCNIPLQKLKQKTFYFKTP